VVDTASVVEGSSTSVAVVASSASVVVAVVAAAVVESVVAGASVLDGASPDGEGCPMIFQQCLARVWTGHHTYTECVKQVTERLLFCCSARLERTISHTKLKVLVDTQASHLSRLYAAKLCEFTLGSLDAATLRDGR
jgi:hypothetical protein